jgi:hypothetical protein
MMAMQDQVIATRNYRKVVLKEKGVEDKCRQCGAVSGTIQYILNECSKLAPEEYKK